MELGRADLGRGAFAQARQAFRRAVAAVPEKLLLGQALEDLARFAALERASLLNQALCAQKLAESAEMPAAQTHWEEVVRVCSLLLRRHLGEGVAEAEREAPELEAPENTSMLAAALRAVSRTVGFERWAAKAHFRRGLARERLSYISDAVADFAAAQHFEPADAAISSRLDALRQRQSQVELRPARMFNGILDREREVREGEEAVAALEEKRQRREARLRRQAAQAVGGGATVKPSAEPQADQLTGCG
mmetsp:Transcript_93039/g.282333  ORF Transcript_93039/g.282333 Transcript_93039/m.282333 type:complete len:249 (+) Transcript_93039:32-778(+)